MPVWLWFVEPLAASLSAAIGLLLVLVLRRRALQRPRGSFALSVKRASVVSPRGWRPGIALYRADEVLWFSLFSLAWWPKYRLHRGEVTVEGRRAPVGQEIHVLPPDNVIATCVSDIGVSQLAMTVSSLTGLLAWMEASPPGRNVSRVL
jgi:hypothetical protein